MSISKEFKKSNRDYSDSKREVKYSSFSAPAPASLTAILIGGNFQDQRCLILFIHSEERPCIYRLKKRNGGGGSSWRQSTWQAGESLLSLETR